MHRWSRNAASAALAVLALAAGLARAEGDTPGFVQPLRPDVPWQAAADLGGGIQRAVAAGDPASGKPYVLMLRFPPNARVQPRTDADLRAYVVVSGTLYVGWGTSFDPQQVTAQAAGTRFIVPAGTSYYCLTRSAVAIVQVDGTGAKGTQFIVHGRPAKETEK